VLSAAESTAPLNPRTVMSPPTPLSPPPSAELEWEALQQRTAEDLPKLQDMSAVIAACKASGTLRKRGGSFPWKWKEQHCHLAEGGVLTTHERKGAPIHKMYVVSEVRAHPSAKRRLVFVLKQGGEVHAEARDDAEVASFVGVAQAVARRGALVKELNR